MDGLIKKAADNLSIVRVNLRNCIININDRFIPGVHIPEDLTNLKLTIQRLSKPLNWKEFLDNENGSNLMTFDHLMAARLTHLKDNDKDDDIVFANIECIFSAIYHLKTKLDDNCLNEFGMNNVEYHVTPYWRAKLQSICVDTNLPIIDVPFYIKKTNSKIKKCENAKKRKMKPKSKSKPKAKAKAKTKT